MIETGGEVPGLAPSQAVNDPKDDQPMHAIHGQPVATTHPDRQGERATKERLERIRDGFSKRCPLYQNHDMGRETIGYLENFRVVPDPQSDGDWLLKADIYFTTENVDEALQAFSYSLIERSSGNLSSAEYEIDLPWPHYNDAHLIDDLVASDHRLSIGRWIKKGIDPGDVALLFSFGAFLLAPAWTKVYDKEVHPRLLNLLQHLPRLRQHNLSAQLVQVVRYPGIEPLSVHFVPHPGREAETLESALIKGALRELKTFLDTDKRAHVTGVDRVRMYFDHDRQRYVLFHIQYNDGTDLNIA